MLQKKFAIFWVIFFTFSGVAGQLCAQETPTVESAIEDMSLGGRAFDKSPVPKSSVSPVNLQVQWRLWKKVRTTNQPGSDELTALNHDGRSLGYMNQPGYALSVTANALAEQDVAMAKTLFKRAQELAPNLPYPYLAEAAYLAPKEPGAFPEWGKKLWVGIKTAVDWPDTSIPWVLKLLLFSLLALAIAGLVFTLGQLLRNLPVVAYDATRIMPKGFSSNQTAIILIALMVVPGIVLRSPLISTLLMLALVALVQNWREKAISVVTFSLLIALPWANDFVYDFASYFGSTTQTVARAQYIGCDEACQETIDALLANDPDNVVLRYTSLIAAYRTGERSALDRILEETKDEAELAGYMQNLRGAALVSIAKPADAAEVLADAATKLPGSAAPRFNLMRAYQMQDKLDDAATALDAAVDADLTTVTQYLTYVRRDVNSFLIVEPMPLASLRTYHLATRPKEISSAVESVWRAIAGPTIELAMAPFVGGIGILFVLLGVPLRLRGKSSHTMSSLRNGARSERRK